MHSKLWQHETWVFLCVFVLLAWIGQKQFLFDPGVFWGTVVGQRILTTHDVPHRDEFSFTVAGTRGNPTSG